MTRTIQPGQAYVTPDHIAARARAGNQAQREELRRLREPREDAAPAPRMLQRNALVYLASDGRLPPESLRAGQEIAAVFYAITAGLGGRITAQYGERLPASPADDWVPNMRTAYVERYAPWSDWAGTHAVGRSTMRNLTLLVAADNLGGTQVGMQIGAHHATVLNKLRASLWWYAQTGGWINRPYMHGESEMQA